MYLTRLGCSAPISDTRHGLFNRGRTQQQQSQIKPYWPVHLSVQSVIAVISNSVTTYPSYRYRTRLANFHSLSSSPNTLSYYNTVIDQHQLNIIQAHPLSACLDLSYTLLNAIIQDPVKLNTVNYKGKRKLLLPIDLF